MYIIFSDCEVPFAQHMNTKSTTPHVYKSHILQLYILIKVPFSKHMDIESNMFVSPTSLSDERWSSKYTQIFLLIEYPYPQHVDIGVHMLHMTPCNALFIAVIAQLNCQRILPFFPFFLLFFSPAITKQFQLQVVITTVRSKYLICFI